MSDCQLYGHVSDINKYNLTEITSIAPIVHEHHPPKITYFNLNKINTGILYKGLTHQKLENYIPLTLDKK